ncbi:MAG: hypothetical protein QXI33_02890 [Candidatus Pacearchaeota archaeon]
MSYKQFIKELNGKRPEGELIKTWIYSLLTSLIIIGVMYYVKFRYIENFVPKYGYFLFFAAIGYAFILSTVKQVRSYGEFACMSGMMIGMTTGMMSGFLAGFYVGAINGMFIGTMFGIFVGIPIGIWLGKCCGIMGIMEGAMAGLMSGIMGAMTSVMMINDNLKIATLIISIISWIIIICLNYLIYTEMKENNAVNKLDDTITIGLTMILISITIWLMVYGPKGPFLS